MPKHQKFILKPEHIKLLRRMNVEWSDIEFGVPVIDYKRPYGNSDVYSDIAEILGYVYNHDYDIPQHFLVEFDKLHQETKEALQIVLSTGKFAPGEYVSDDFGLTWREKENRPEWLK